jgi:succinate dehydrogenase / fumarate reductase membrane anchor subunit
MNNLRTPLSKVKGLGSAKSGTEHFIMQRITALALIPLVIWFCLSLAFLPNANYASVVMWLSSPFNAVLLVVTLIAGFYHGALGLQVIFEDYISSHGKRTIAIIISNLVLFFFAALGVYSVLKISILG